ncbi:MAG: DUF3037 domain-containing protein [Verrucomicrobiota bacterium]
MKTIAKHVCNYAVLRFLPYPETGEFVNLGVVVHCADLGFFGVELERRKISRVTNFFPELVKDQFKSSQAAIWAELERVRDQMNKHGQTDLKRRVFRELIRPRESIFRFSEVKTVLTDNPKELVATLFAQYVRRHFALTKEHQEGVMARRYYRVLREFCPERIFHQNRLVGKDEYRVRVPLSSDFVGRNGVPLRVIKPLDLDRDEPSEIIDHGDGWIGKVRRLGEIGCLPDRFIFAVSMPSIDGKPRDAAEKILADLRKEDALIVMASQTDQLIALAGD